MWLLPAGMGPDGSQCPGAEPGWGLGAGLGMG